MRRTFCKHRGGFLGLLICALVGGLVLTMVPGRGGAECTDYDEYLTWYSSLIVDDHCPDLAIQGNYAYVLAYISPVENSQLRVYDISLPNFPQLIAQVPCPGAVNEISVSGNYAAVGKNGPGVSVYDISDPASPIERGVALDGSCALHVTLVDSLLYVGTYYYEDTFKILSIADPDNPVLLDSVDLPAYAYQGMEVVGNYAYLGCGVDLLTFDVSDPGEINLVDTDNMVNSAIVDMDYYEGSLYLSTRDNGNQQAERIEQFRISNPADPQFVRDISTGTMHENYYTRLSVSAGICYWGYQSINLPTRMLDVSTSNWQDLGALDGPDGILGWIEAIGNRLFVSRNFAGSLPGEVQIVSVSSPDPLEPLSSLPTNGEAQSVVISPAKNNLAYVADGDAGLTIVDISDPLAPFIVGSVDTPGFATELALAGDIAIVADGDAGLHSVDVSVSATPFIRDSLDTPGSAVDIVAQSNYVYVADSGAGVRIVNFADPDTLKTASVVTGLTDCSDIDVDGIYAYAADGIEGLKVLNVSDPDNPWIIDDVKGDPLTSARRVDVERGRAYVTFDEPGVAIVDVSDTNNFVVLGDADTFNSASDIDVMGIFAYVGSGANMRLVDVQDDSNPVIAGNVSIPTVSKGVFINEHFAYVAAGNGGLQICPTQCGFDETVYADFTPTPQQDWFPITVNFTNESLGYGLSYEWDFGDGVGTSTEDHPTYDYDLPGNYPVRLIAANGTIADTLTVVISAKTEEPIIRSIADVPDDQGGWVYITFDRSGFDDTGLGNKIEMYTIERKVGDLWIAVANTGATASSPTPFRCRPPGMESPPRPNTGSSPT
jgi:hypothetical protein